MYLSAEKKWKVRTSDRLFGKMRRWMRSLSVLSSEWEAFSFTSEQSGWKEKVHIIGSRLNSNLLPVLFVFTTCHWHQAMSVFQWDVGGGGGYPTSTVQPSPEETTGCVQNTGEKRLWKVGCWLELSFQTFKDVLIEWFFLLIFLISANII